MVKGTKAAVAASRMMIPNENIKFSDFKIAKRQSPHEQINMYEYSKPQSPLDKFKAVIAIH